MNSSVELRTLLRFAAESSGGLFHYLAVLPDDQREFHGAVLGLNVFGGTTKRAFSATDERWDFVRFRRVSVFLHKPINCRTDSISSSEEMASRFGGIVRLSQIAQCVASGR